MREEKVFAKFIKHGDFSEENIEELKDTLLLKDSQLIRKTFKLLNDEIAFLDKELYYKGMIENCIEFLSCICNEKNFKEEDVIINRKRIKKSREAILAYAHKYNDDELLQAANKLDEIILDKGINLKDLVRLLKKLIDKKEDFNIIKRLLNTNKGVLIMDKNELFDYTFDKAINSIKISTPDIYYYIALLKIFYSSKIDLKHYLERLNNETDESNDFANEIYYILHGHKRQLSREQIISKYGVYTELDTINIINPEKTIQDDDLILSIDATGTTVRDDALSIKKSGDKYIVGIHIAAPGLIINPGTYIDMQARNNFECIFLPDGGTKILNGNIENALSLNKNTYRHVISMYVVLDSDGFVVDYKIIENDIKINENFDFSEADILLNQTGYIQNKLHLLSEVADLLEMRNSKKYIYWEKKENSSLDNEPRPHKSDKIVSELMVLYNSLIATTACNSYIPYVYRTQSNTYLNNLVKKLGIEVDDEAKKVIDNIYLKSRYSEVPIFHSGLNLPIYSHSSSALRRYPDLYNQQLLNAFYFKNINMDFNPDEHKRLIEYFNQRSIELSLMGSEYIRALKPKKD